jgi:hypothetical protein
MKGETKMGKKPKTITEGTAERPGAVPNIPEPPPLPKRKRKPALTPAAMAQEIVDRLAKREERLQEKLQPVLDRLSRIRAVLEAVRAEKDKAQQRLEFEWSLEPDQYLVA